MVSYVRVVDGTPVEHVRLEETAPAPDGWLPLIRTARPSDTETTTFDRSFDVGTDSVQEVWVERLMTADEQALAARSSTAGAIEAKVDAAITADLAWLNRTTTPTNVQVLNHVDRLTRQVVALLRASFDRLDTTEGA